MENIDKLKVVYGDFTLGITYDKYEYLFSYAQKGLESLRIDKVEWLYRSPRPTFWRALTDNDRGSGFHLTSGMWMACDMFCEGTTFEVIMDGISQGQPIAPLNNKYLDEVYADEMIIRYTYQTISVPKTEVDITYIVSKEGLKVEVYYHGKEGLPSLPVFGWRMVIPELISQYTYYGLSGECYPDRKQGGILGEYTIDDLSLTPYLVPQDCNVRMDCQWVILTKANSQLTIICEKPLAMACLPYSAIQIEEAKHQFELAPPRRTYLNIYGALRGVGGIDSWGSDIEADYVIDASKDIKFSFVIK